MSTNTEQIVVGPARQRWIAIRTAAGFTTDVAIERALTIAGGSIWLWIVKGREPHLSTMRRLKELFGISLDELDEIIVGWRAEMNGQVGAQEVERAE